jgi:uncharacterized membrane protein YedE/YeeE
VSQGSASKPYADPYIAGVGLGLVLLGAFVFAGRGLGASGAFASAAANAVNLVSKAQARGNFFFDSHLDAPLWRDWLFVELAGVVIGAWISAKLAGRTRLMIERGSKTSISTRLSTAVIGGTAMGVGAVFARGCTSGQALTGGALLSVGSWVFIAGAFGAAYAVSLLRRSAWS